MLVRDPGLPNNLGIIPSVPVIRVTSSRTKLHLAATRALAAPTARATNTLPELEPGSVLFTRLWPLGVGTIVVGAIAFLFPQPAAVGAGS